MKLNKKNRVLINQMNVVPYIDVMLVLLIIFMVTAPMFVPSVINLPSVGSANHISTMPIEIGININNQYTITQNKQTVSKNNITQLISAVGSLAKSKDAPIVISADKNIKYDNVIHTIDSLYTAGFKKVSLVVKTHE